MFSVFLEHEDRDINRKIIFYCLDTCCIPSSVFLEQLMILNFSCIHYFVCQIYVGNILEHFIETWISLFYVGFICGCHFPWNRIRISFNFMSCILLLIFYSVSSLRFNIHDCWTFVLVGFPLFLAVLLIKFFFPCHVKPNLL